jgi:ribonuclease III
VLSARDRARLEGVVGYRFTDSQLLRTSLTHRSFANESRDEGLADNEKLEFLGDAVLDLVISHELMLRFPDLDEGALSVNRARLVSEVGLSQIAREIQLGDWLLLGKGEEKTGGRDKSSVLSDAFEALCAAIYLDGGFAAAQRVLVPLFEEQIASIQPQSTVDYKTRLQEMVQAAHRSVPEYRLVRESGPDHDKTFEVAVVIDGKERARCEGKSKKAAEQGAARQAVECIDDWR